MYVEVDLNTPTGAFTVREADDFTAFKLVVSGGGRELAEALGPIGRLDGPEHAYLRPAAVAALAGAAGTQAGWQERFAEMLAYAASKGWTDEHGDVRAHIERKATT